MEEQKGRLGIAVILAILLAAAVVSRSVSAMAGDIEHCTVHNSLVIPPEVTIKVKEDARRGSAPAARCGGIGA